MEDKGRRTSSGRSKDDNLFSITFLGEISESLEPVPTRERGRPEELPFAH